MIVYKGITKMYNDLLFIGAYVEYISRATKNKQVTVMDRAGCDDLKHIYDCADANHCLPLAQHLAEYQQKYHLPLGNHDTSSLVKDLPIESPIVGEQMIASMIEEMGVIPSKAFDKFWEIHHSEFASDLLDYSKALYFQPVQYLVYCYKTGSVDWENLPVAI